MRRPETLRKRAVPLILALAAAFVASAAERRIDHRFAAASLPTLIGLPLTGEHALVTPDGGLAFADGSCLLLVRHMLVCDRGDEIHLCSAVLAEWMAGEFNLRLMRRAGCPVGFQAALQPNSRSLSIKLFMPTATPQNPIVFHLPRPPRPIRSLPESQSQYGPKIEAEKEAVKITGFSCQGSLLIEFE